jgi:hypothetical protein
MDRFAPSRRRPHALKVAAPAFDLTPLRCSFTPFMGMCRRGRLARSAGVVREGGTLTFRFHRSGDHSMKRMLALALALAGAVSLSACQTPQQTNALAGGALGGGAGALIGSAVSGGSAGGTLAGAAIGAASGAMIGAAATPQPTGNCARWGYDYNGNHVCVAYY